MSFDWTTRGDLIESLPLNGGYDVMTDRETGISMRVPRPRHFIITDDDTFCVTDRRTGECWRIGVDMDGEYWKEPLLITP